MNVYDVKHLEGRGYVLIESKNVFEKLLTVGSEGFQGLVWEDTTDEYRGSARWMLITPSGEAFKGTAKSVIGAANGVEDELKSYLIFR